MEYRRLGRTGLQISVVGFGTNELRLVPETQAIDALLRAFELGVNIVHTSPDYEGAEDIVAKAVARTDRKIIVASQAYDVHYNTSGPVHHFERLFEGTCARLRTDRLDLFGIAAVDDREAFQENVWGRHGMVEYLLRMKQQGRLGGIYCTNHGEPAHMRRLIESGVFDAMMISLNPLGYHLLTLNPPAGRHFENVDRNSSEIVPLCRERDIGVMAMMPLAGGLLVDSLAFPPRGRRDDQSQRVTATDVLRTILQDLDVACVMPGTASVVEAEENARAGHQPLALSPEIRSVVSQRITKLKTSVCSRCGACEKTCSQLLPISWLLRAREMAGQPAEAFETWSDVDYFRLHPSLQPNCPTCERVTCACPYGIHLPSHLTETHERMVELLERGLVPPPPGDGRADCGDSTFAARVVMRDIPDCLCPNETRVCRLQLENIGTRGWFPDGVWENGGVRLAVFVNGVQVADAKLRHEVHPGARGHFVFELAAPAQAEVFDLRLRMLAEYQGYAEDAGFDILSCRIPVEIPADGAREPCRAGSRGFGSSGVRTDVASLTPPDPRGARAYAVGWRASNLPLEWTPDEPYYVYLCFENCGTRSWAAQHPEGRYVNLVVRLEQDVMAMFPLPHDIQPGEHAILGFWLRLPDAAKWTLSFTFVEQNVTWFEQKGVAPLTVTIRRAALVYGVSRTAWSLLRSSNPTFYCPSQGVPRSRSGRPYPLLIKEAVGARIRDPEGHEWIDYVMGWGSALLGYAHGEISQSVTNALSCGAVLSLPHEIEAEVTGMLVDLIPCAEMVLFGKNGSDVCSAAVRAARIHTGRRVVLFSGYHGWQEPFAVAAEPHLSSADFPPDVFRFAPYDLEGFRRLANVHRGRIAAVMLEPAAQVEGVDGPVRDADRMFLQGIAEVCREQDAVLIFDEIFTGFRTLGGSVQKSTGVIPDLACFGKALTSGLPLSALVGRRKVLEPVLSKIFYHPTFKGEVYSFAAARTALRIYQRDDVPRRIQAFGQRLMEGVNRISVELGVNGKMIGLPYRMVYVFNDANERRRAHLRTLLQQELLQRGILTFRGFMLPSLAHGELELDETLAAFHAALTCVLQVTDDAAFASHLEIPLVY